MNCVQARRGIFRLFALLSIVAMLCAGVSPANAQQKDKKKKKDTPVEENDPNASVVPRTDEQQIDYIVSDVLGAWQLGDTDHMHKSYSDDVSVINGGWAPPILGWKNYETLFKQQRAQMQQVRMDRSNTYIKVSGTTAWASFQWEFAAVINGTPSAAKGLTTYVLIKKDNHWLIAHDHTSVVEKFSQPPPGNITPTGATGPPKPAN